ncbi:MAG: hypothetical protein U0N23_06845, partial [Parasutterella excrementihominis]
MIKKEKNSAQSAAVIFGSTETTTPKTNAEAILEAAEKSFFIVIYSFVCVSISRQTDRPILST